MSRKPVDQQQPTECRQAVWDWIREHKKPFTVFDINVRLESKSVRDYIIGLVRAGYLEEQTGPRFKATTYRLIKDTGHDAPRVRRDGTLVTQGQGRQQMWNTMRIIKEFSITDLAFNASTDGHTVAESEAKAYCSALCIAGYNSHTHNDPQGGSTATPTGTM